MEEREPSYTVGGNVGWLTSRGSSWAAGRMVLFCSPEVPVPRMGGPPDLSIDYSGEQLEMLIWNLVRDLESARTFHHLKMARIHYGT